MDGLGDRMKAYERRETGRAFLPMLPVYARIDGRGFSRFTAGMQRPFDADFSAAMIATSKQLVDHLQARIGYTQSDEISLLWLAEDPKSEIPFAGKAQKMVSVLAGLATAAFTRAILDGPLASYAERLPHFDARVFQLPSKEEAANMILWREADATKNAISMAARHYYPHEALNEKTGSQMQELLFAKGVNFNDYSPRFKRGTYVRRTARERTIAADELARIPNKHRPDPQALVTRYAVEELELPRLSQIRNRVEVLFHGADPITDEGTANTSE